MNHITIMGRLTKDVELKNTASGVEVATVSVAVDRKTFSKDAEKKTDFFNCTAWRATAAFLDKYFKKGDGIILSGRMENDPYEKDGVKRDSWKLIIDSVEFPMGKGNGKSAPVEASEPAFTETEDTGDLPF